MTNFIESIPQNSFPRQITQPKVLGVTVFMGDLNRSLIIFLKKRDAKKTMNRDSAFAAIIAVKVYCWISAHVDMVQHVPRPRALTADNTTDIPICADGVPTGYVDRLPSNDPVTCAFHFSSYH